MTGLKALEYRGYDSAGLVTIDHQTMHIKKDVGDIDSVEQRHNLLNLPGSCGIAHTRWATHGAVSQENAHPHTCSTGNIAIAHNGIIENYKILRDMLRAHGHTFKSRTDSEVIAHLIEHYYTGDAQRAFVQAISQLEGSYAIAMVCLYEDALYVARRDSPLVLGPGEHEFLIASDVTATIHMTDNIIYLEDHQYAIIQREGMTVFSADGKKVTPEITTVDWTPEMTQKSGYKHYMLKEIHHQPQAIEATVANRITDTDISLADEIPFSQTYIQSIDRIIMVACGTSWHACLTGEFMLEELLGIPVEVEYASEFRYRNPIIRTRDLVIAVSQSGETADTIAALREAKSRGAHCLSICNVNASSLARISDTTLYTAAGVEIGVASTKAFTTQCVVLYLLTLHLGVVRQSLPGDQIHNRIRDLRLLPLQIEAILEQSTAIRKLAEHFLTTTNFLYLGRGINFPIALEGALKLKEISYIHAEGYPAAEMKHGPIALIDEKMPVIFVATHDDRTYTKIISNVEEVRSRGGLIIAIASEGDTHITEHVDHVIHIPKNSYILSPLLAVVPLQLLAYHIADIRNINVDKPRNLAKSVTVE